MRHDAEGPRMLRKEFNNNAVKDRRIGVGGAADSGISISRSI